MVVVVVVVVVVAEFVVFCPSGRIGFSKIFWTYFGAFSFSRNSWILRIFVLQTALDSHRFFDQSLVSFCPSQRWILIDLLLSVWWVFVFQKELDSRRCLEKILVGFRLPERAGFSELLSSRQRWTFTDVLRSMGLFVPLTALDSHRVFDLSLVSCGPPERTGLPPIFWSECCEFLSFKNDWILADVLISVLVSFLSFVRDLVLTDFLIRVWSSFVLQKGFALSRGLAGPWSASGGEPWLAQKKGHSGHPKPLFFVFCFFCYFLSFPGPRLGHGLPVVGDLVWPQKRSFRTPGISRFF